MIARVSLCIFLILKALFSQAQQWTRLELLENPTTGLDGSIIGGKCYSDTCCFIENGGRTIYTTGFFSSWSVDTTFSNERFGATSFPEGGYGFATSSTLDNGFTFTNNKGLSWNTLPTNISQISDFFGVEFINTDTGFLYSRYQLGGISRTVDGGGTWSPLTLTTQCRSIFRVHFVNDSLGFFLSSTNPTPDAGLTELQIYKSVNSGLSWTNLTILNATILPSGIADFYYLNSSVCILVVNNIILRSVDGGFSYDTVKVIPPSESISLGASPISFVNSQIGYIAFPSSVYKTIDGGASWQKTAFSFETQDNIDNSINFIHALSLDTVILGCNKGTVYFTITGGGIWSGVNEIEGVKVNLHPNPAITTITLSGTEPGSTATITNLHGQVVLLSKIEHSGATISVESLPPGLYICIVESRQERKVLRFVKQ